MAPPLQLSPELVAYFVRLGKLVRKGYADGFLDNPGATDVSDLGMELITIIHAEDSDGELRPYGTIARDATNVFIGIRGTEGGAEWISDADAFQVDFPVMRSTLTPKVHRGFARIYNTMRTAEGLLIKHHPVLVGASVVVTGHSLGAALATLLAADVGAFDLCTFAGPRVGDPDFCECAAQRIIRTERFVNVPDLVPKVPFNLPDFPYAELGLPILLDSEGLVREDPHAWHSLDTYLHLIDVSFPIDSKFQIPAT